METYFYNLQLANTETQYTLSADSACLGLVAGTYSHNQMLTAIINKLCATASDLVTLESTVAAIVANPNTTDVTLDGIVLPTCFSAFVGLTSTDLFNAILTEVCTLMSNVGPTSGTGPIIVTPPDPGQNVDPATASYASKAQSANHGTVSEVFTAITDNDSFIYDHTAPSVSPTSFTANIKAMKGVVETYLVIRDSNEDFTVNASKDTYFYLSADGTILKLEVVLAAPAPATPTASHPLYFFTSDGSGITLVTNLFTSTGLNPTPLSADDVLTVHIKDLNVTPAKLANVGVSATYGDASLFQMRTNAAGQVDLVTANASFAGVGAGDILVYNAGLSRFEVQANTFISSSNVIPKANAAGTDYEDSSISEVTNQIEVIKKIEVNTGVAVDDSEAILNLVATDSYFLPPRMTHAQAGALTLTNGALIYVTSTDATFTSVGFWGVEAGAWVKL